MTFLIICTMGISQKHAAVILKVNQSSISRRFNRVLQSFQEQIIPHQIGLKNLTLPVIRERHTPRLFSSLFQNVVLVCDGTYIYTQKSENFKTQKKTYSMHKHRSLVKFLVFTAPNGRVVEAFGPFLADGHHNDEWLFNYCFDMPESPLRQHLDLERDETMCDRGFNRAEDYVRLHSPKSIAKGQSQMSVSNCNYTRCVTRLRQVIERLFGRLKHWKLIYNVVDTAYIPMIRPIFLSLCCMDNMFFPPLFQDSPENDDGDIIRLLISLHQAENHVKEPSINGGTTYGRSFL